MTEPAVIRSPLKLLAVFVLVHVPLWVPSSSLLADEARPNILWISCEDISAHLGCYGDPDARTPNLDRLAARGVRYDNAFVCAGVCAPCRSTVITGMYQTSIGTHHMRCSAVLPSWMKPFTIDLREAGYYCTNNSKKDYQFKEPKGTWDESSGKAHWRKRPDPEQPFFAVFNFTECHESGIASDGKYKRVTQGLTPQDPDTIRSYPPYYPDTPAAKADWGRYYDVVTAMDRRVGALLAQLEEDGLRDNTIVIFWSDHGVGLPRAKRWVYDSGMKVPLIVAAPRKWRGLVEGAPGSSTDRLVSLMDLGPSALTLAGLAPPKWMQGRAFLGREADAPREYVYAARDRMDERYDIIRAVRDKRFKYIRNYEPFKPYFQYINTAEKGRLMKEYRRVANQGALPQAALPLWKDNKPSEELYDTKADPHEIHNLAGDPNYAEQLKRLREAHLDWVLRTRDLGLIPEPIIAAREASAGSRHALLQGAGGDQLIKRLRQAASDSLRDEEGAEAMVAHLSDTDAAVRYWGAIGVGNLNPTKIDKSLRAKAGVQLGRLLTDSSPTVRVAAARAVARWGNVDNALPVMTEVLKDGAQWERLHAIIALDELDEEAKPVLKEMKAALKYRDGFVARGKYVVRVANRALNELLGTSNTVP